MKIGVLFLLWIAVISISTIPTSCLYRHCGRRLISTEDYKRIVGGRESARGAWPWQVVLLFRGKQYCGGSLVSSSWVVSAAHCFTADNLSAAPSDWSVILGEHHLQDYEVFEEQISVEEIIVHPEYRYEGDDSKIPPYFDIALVKLEIPATLGIYAWPICLLTDDIMFLSGKECVTTGWGHTESNGNQPDIIREAKVRLIPHDVCNSQTSYQGRVHELGLCADVLEDAEKTWTGSPCNFDSGGPLACMYNGRYYLAGVTSWSEGDCGTKLHVFANMWQLTSWVRQTVKDEE